MNVSHFLQNWTIDLTKLPAYDKFSKPFTVSFDKNICNLLMSGINPKVTKLMITNFKNNVLKHIDDNDKLTVSHFQAYGLGRFYGCDDISPCVHSKFIKHTVFAYQNWLDIDMVKGHTSILLHIAKKNGETVTSFQEVVDNFDKKWREIAEYFNKKCSVELDEDNVKYFFNMTIYGGGYKRWLKKLADEKDAEKYGYAVKIIPENIAIHPFMDRFYRDCKKIRGLICENNPAIVDLVGKKKEMDHEKERCVMSYFCGIIENDILYFVYNFLVKKGGILPYQCLLELDGLCLPRLEGVDYNELVDDMNGCLSAMEIRFKIKPYGKFVLNDIIQQREEMDEETEDEGGVVEEASVVTEAEQTETVDEPAMITVDILEKGENDVAQFITPLLKNNVVFCRNQWFVFDKNTGLWVVKHPSASIISCIQLKIDEAMGHLHLDMSRTGDTSGDRYKTMKETSKQFKGHYSKVCKCGYTSSVVNFLKDYLSDDGFVDKLDKQTYVAVFEDGLLDLKTLLFRSGIKQTDFVSKTIPFKYEKPKDEDIAFVREVIKKICNYKEEHLDYYLSTLGYALTGDASLEQLFWYLRGQTAENGKSFIFETLEELMPCYVSKGSSDILDKGADIRKDLATWRALRILWLNEVSTKKKDEDLTKALCDGTNYKNKELYSIKTVSVDISFKLFGVSNKTLKIDGDAGVKRRFRLMQFNSQFKDDYDCDYETLQFKRDKELGAKLQGQYKHALLHLIFTYSKHYADEKKLRPYPDEWKEEADEVMVDNDKFASWFNDRFVVGADKIISKKDFEYLVSLLPMKGVNVKDELKRMRVAFKYDSQMYQMIDGKRVKGWYVGFGEKCDD